MPGSVPHPNPKRTYDDLTKEHDALDDEINVISKRQRILYDEIRTRPEEDARINGVAAKTKADMRAADRAILLDTLPPALSAVLMDNAARTAWPELGSLTSIYIDVGIMNVRRLMSADVVRVNLRFEKDTPFEGAIFTETGDTVPNSVIRKLDDDDDDDGTEAAIFKSDPWKWALRWNNDPTWALCALIMRGIMELDGTDDEIRCDEDQVAAQRKVWARIYPAAQ